MLETESTAKPTESPHLLPQTEKPYGTLDFSMPKVFNGENSMNRSELNFQQKTQFELADKFCI